MPTITGASRKQAGLYYDKGAHVFNIMHPDFGASPTASAAVNKAAIQAAIDAANAAGGGTVFVPRGDFSHDGNLVLKSNVRLEGVGYGSHLDCTGVTVRAIENENRTGPALTDTNIGIYNLRSTNSGAVSTSGFSHCADLRYVKGLFVDRFWADTTADGDGLYLRGNQGVDVGTIVIGSVSRQGMSVSSGSDYRIGHVIGIACNASYLVDIEPNTGDTINGIHVGKVEVLSGTANGLNCSGDPSSIFDLTVDNLKTITTAFQGVVRYRIGKITAIPTGTAVPAVTLFHANQGTIGRIDALGAGIAAQKLAVSSCDDVTIDGFTAVGPGGNSVVTLDVLACTSLKINNVKITSGGIYALRCRNSNDVIIDGYVVDGASAGTYGFNITSTTANGNITIRGIRVTNYPTGGRVELAANIVTLEGDVSACAASLSVSSFTGYLQANALRGYASFIFPVTSVPTRGVYFRGDRLPQRQPSVGNPKGWIISTGGGLTSTTRANSTVYALGVWAIWTTGTTVWEVTTAGTSDVAAPSIVGKVVGDTVVDGTVTWTMRSLTTAVATSEGNL